MLLGKAGQPGQPMVAPYKAVLSAETLLTFKDVDAILCIACSSGSFIRVAAGLVNV